MADLFDTDEQFENIKSSLSTAIEGALSMDGKKNRLVVRSIEIEDTLDPDDLKSQLNAKMEQRTWGVPLYATIELRDKATNQKIDRSRVKLLDIPKLTPRYSFIINGSEFQVSNQLRLKPGTYVRKRRTGETEAQINLERGGQWSLDLKPKTNRITANVRGVNVNAYSLLKVLGLKDQQIEASLGSELHSAIVTPNVDADILKLHQAVFRRREADVEKAITNLREWIDTTKLDPETTEATLGRGYSKVTGDMLLRTLDKLVKVYKGEVPEDNRDEIRFKRIMTPDDLLEQRISRNVRNIQSRIKPKLDTATEVRQVVQPKQISKLIYSGRGESAEGSFYNSSTLSNNPDQTNPVDFLNGFSRVTYMGEGGLKSGFQVNLETRSIDPTQVGFLDPVHTPESSDIGVTNHLPIGVQKIRGELRTRVEDRKGKISHISAPDAHGQTIAFPGELDDRWKPIWKGKVSAYQGGKVVEVDPKEVTHRFVNPADLFGVSTNLIPFLSANSGARAMFGAKMMEQAVPLIEREAPLVQARLKGQVTADAAVGQEFSVHAPVAGKVMQVGEGLIVIRDEKGKKHEVQYYDNFPLNSDTGITSDLRVEKGDVVKAGQLLADTNFTRDGVLAIGKNLRVAYLPYKGYTFEDGIVVSESAAKKLTSEHVHRREAPKVRLGGIATVYDKEKFRSYYPTEYTTAQLGKLDKEGVVRIGQKVSPGDPLIAYMQEKALTPEDIAMGKLRRSLVKPYKNKSMKWDMEEEGEVVRVAKTAEGPTVWVRTKESIRIGDKLSGRHGNKGVVTMVVPDREMPRTLDDDPVDIIMDPHGIPSRINVGQVFESVAGKIADKTGKTYVVDNFTPEPYVDRLQGELAKAKIPECEPLKDPTSGETLNTCMVGRQYIMKLRHPVRSKFSARGTDKYTHDLRPAKGGDESAQSLDPLKIFSMVAHGAKENVREMSTYKAQQNDEFWLALQHKQALPPPKPTFAWEKFRAMMNAVGVNVQKEGDTIRPMPLTDDEILAMSSGQIEDARFFRAKDMRPEKGGLFDPLVTGGVGGGRWSHIPLAEAMPNPIFEDAIKSLTGLKAEEYDDLVAGRIRVAPNGELVRE